LRSCSPRCRELYRAIRLWQPYSPPNRKQFRRIAITQQIDAGRSERCMPPSRHRSSGHHVNCQHLSPAAARDFDWPNLCVSWPHWAGRPPTPPNCTESCGRCVGAYLQCHDAELIDPHDPPTSKPTHIAPVARHRAISGCHACMTSPADSRATLSDRRPPGLPTGTCTALLDGPYEDGRALLGFSPNVKKGGTLGIEIRPRNRYYACEMVHSVTCVTVFCWVAKRLL